MANFPSNSYKNKNEKDKKKKNLKKLVSTSPEVRKKPLGRKLTETMFNTDVRSAKRHLVDEFIIPNILDFITDSLHEMVDTFINKGNSSYSGRSYKSGSKTSYEKYFYKQNGGGSKASEVPFDTSTSPYDAVEYIFVDRGEADRVLEEMRGLIKEFGEVTLNDYYELVGLTSTKGSATDADFGWKNLDRVTISTIRGQRGAKAFVINLPRVEQLK